MEVLSGCIGTGIRIGPVFIPLNTETVETQTEREQCEQQQQEHAEKKAAAKDASDQSNRDDDLGACPRIAPVARKNRFEAVFVVL